MRMNTVQETVYNALKEGIITLALEPGSVISAPEISARINASRTPVREACIKLQREGLLLVMPQRETVVSKINLERVEEELFIRSSLELSLIDKLKEYKEEIPVKKIKGNLQEQEKCLADNNYLEFLKLDNEFHGMLFEAAHEKLSWDTIMSVNGHYSRVRVYNIKEHNQMYSFIEEHKKLFSVLCEENWSELQTLIKHHTGKKIDAELLMRERPDYFILKEEVQKIMLV